MGENMCKQEDMSTMRELFSNCTAKYKAEYTMSLEEEEVQEVVCRLVENIVSRCGDVWRQCHSEEEVRRMKELHVETLVSKNRGTNVDIEQCSTVQQFRSQYD